MYLKAIELQGFKSFPDKTKIEFTRGMSGVVGPNGSGKSNISDAIRWVLGETKGSRLRANGKMEDIIFGGSAGRNPMGYAWVSLTLDNSRHTFDVESDEITVMRKYYRGGDSEYYINGSRVRLRDIQELFFDTGLGKNGYSIVSQGKVNEIVTAKPENRREIFEEASGIAKFRFKKTEAERKLASAEENITRLTDILTGLEERVEPLRKESEKAKEFIRLSRQKKEAEISLWMDKVDKSKELIRSRQRRLEVFNEDYEAVDKKLSQGEKYLEERYLLANSLLVKKDENTDEIRARENEISSLETDIAVIDTDIKRNLRQIEELKKQAADFENTGAERLRRQKETREKIARLEEKILEGQKNRAALQMKLDGLIAEAREKGDERTRINGEINSLNLKIQEDKIELSSLESRSETLATSLKNAEESLETARRYHRETRENAGELKEFIETTDEEINKNTNIKNGLLLKRKSAEEKLSTISSQIVENQNRQRATADRIRILTDLENNMDGFAQSVKTVLNRAKSGSLGGIIGSVAQIIAVEKGYETAVEIALGYGLQNIVVENEQSAKRAIEFLKQSKGGRATFLPLDTVKPSNFNEKLPRWARTADTVVTAEPRFKNIISNLLGRTIFTEDINSASNLAKSLNYRYKIVTLDGQQINAGGSFTGGSTGKGTGLFTRKTEIENLRKNLEGIKAEELGLDKIRQSAQNDFDALNASIEACLGDIEDLNTDKANAQIEYARLSGMANNYRGNIENLKKSVDNYKNTILQSRDKKAKILKEIRDNTEKAQALGESARGMEREDLQSTREQNRITGEISAINLKNTELAGSVGIEREKLSSILAGIKNSAERKEEIRLQIENLEKDSGEKSCDKDEKNRKIHRLREKIIALEEENKSFAEKRIEIEGERNKLSRNNKELSRQREGLNTQIARETDKIKSMETDYDEIISKLWEEYELTVTGAREIAVEVTDEAEMRRKLSAVKNSIRRLGNVNVGAIEEFKEVNDRYTYLKSQLEDLNGSKNQLVKLITSLSGEMKTMFTRSFNDINEKFGSIFAELFGGGTARLELTDREDVLQSGIEIIVSPPGKVIKSLTALSGGEQALVAISIYFAILEHNPSPFCVLDEIEAALDDVNVARYANYLHRICDKTQFIVITHRRGTMEACDVLYGVTMQEDGISKLLKLDVNNISATILN